jgi:hypothetical protein
LARAPRRRASSGSRPRSSSGAAPSPEPDSLFLQRDTLLQRDTARGGEDSRGYPRPSRRPRRCPPRAGDQDDRRPPPPPPPPRDANSGQRQPALTIMVLAVRAGDYLSSSNRAYPSC